MAGCAIQPALLGALMPVSGSGSSLDKAVPLLAFTERIMLSFC